MPARPSWHANITAIRRSLTAMTSTPFLDRSAIERLFGVRARQANYIMRGLPGRKLGNAIVVDREQLLLKLDDLAGPRGVALAETKRKASVIETLEALKREGRPRRITPPPIVEANVALPAGVRISAPGELTISYSSPEDLLGRVLGLAQAASLNFASFTAGLAFSSHGSSVCTDENA
jgi:hypothetical protein